jgi:hypothetical protein
VTGLDELREALRGTPESGVLHVRTERAGLRELHARIRAAVHAGARAVLG